MCRRCYYHRVKLSRPEIEFSYIQSAIHLFNNILTDRATDLLDERFETAPHKKKEHVGCAWNGRYRLRDVLTLELQGGAVRLMAC